MDSVVVLLKDVERVVDEIYMGEKDVMKELIKRLECGMVLLANV